MPNHENDWENKEKDCTDYLNYPITFEDWDELMDPQLNYCMKENITKTPESHIRVNLTLELDRILNVDQSRNVIENLVYCQI